METADNVIETIQLAFAGVPHGEVRLHEAQVIDNYGSAKERAEARRLDTQSSWNRVSDSEIEECTSALCHLDPEGWKFYVPAYMIWSLRNYRVSDSLVSDHTIYTFNLPEDDARLRDYHLARFRLLDDVQSRAVCRFLRYMAANDDRTDGRVANEALKKYWERYC
jgi:hypothetical protein